MRDGEENVSTSEQPRNLFKNLQQEVYQGICQNVKNV
jgi:hypothetical protein